MSMRKIFCLSMFAALAAFVSCQKQQTEEEKNAEIERQVQQRLAAEHQATEQQQLAQREAELNTREKALTEKESAAVARTATPRVRPPPVAHGLRDTAGNAATASYSTFYTKLEPYGAWRETGDYGYVWQPREAEMSRSWRPYTNGRWVYTDAGWTWISDEPFGWAAYHYGRWIRLRNIGWVWVPGDEWAPAWVSWRKSNDYVGWAPLPPEARFDRRTGIHNWADSYYGIGPDQYCFVPTSQFGGQRVERAVVPAERNVTIVNQTTNVTNITYNNTTIVNQGPNYDELNTRSQQPIQRLRLERQINVNIDIENPRPVVKGEVIEMQAPVIARAEPIERPRSVKEVIGQTIVDRGWEAIADHQAAEKVRAKMKSESTPPPEAPSKTFVKPVQASAEQSVAAPPTSTATATPSPTPASIATPIATLPAEAATSTATPRPKRGRFPAESTETPEPSATSAPTMTPFRRNPPAAAPTATAMLTPSPLPSATATTSPARDRSFSTPTLSPSPSATASPTAASTGAPEGTREEKRGERRRLLGIEEKAKAHESQPGRAVPMTSPTTAATSTSSPAERSTTAISSSSAEKLTKEEKKKQKRERKEAAEAGESVVPSPSETPQ